MIEVDDKSSRTRRVVLTTSPFVTVADVLAFADRLRDEQISPRERIECRHAEETRHLVGLSVRDSRSWDTPKEIRPRPAPKTT